MSLELCDLSISMADYIWPYKVKTFALGRQILLIAHGAMPHYGSYHVCNNVRKFERIFCWYRRERNTCEICWSTANGPLDFQLSGPGNMAITDSRYVFSSQLFVFQIAFLKACIVHLYLFWQTPITATVFNLYLCSTFLKILTFVFYYVSNALLSKQFFSIDCAWFLLEYIIYITIKLLWT